MRRVRSLIKIITHGLPCSGPVLSVIPRTLSATIGGAEKEDNPGYHGPQDVLRSMSFVFYALHRFTQGGGG